MSSESSDHFDDWRNYKMSQDYLSYRLLYWRDGHTVAITAHKVRRTRYKREIGRQKHSRVNSSRETIDEIIDDLQFIVEALTKFVGLLCDLINIRLYKSEMKYHTFLKCSKQG